MNKMMKIAGVVASLALLSACASNSNPDIDSTAGADSTVGAQPSGPTRGSQADLEQSAGHRVFFAYDQYTLTPQAQSTLAKQAAWLKEYPEVRILLAGNCDERGTREYNLALGARRAAAVQDFLVSQGVAANRLRTVTYGKERPIEICSEESCYAQNRRAVTVLGAAVGS